MTNTLMQSWDSADLHRIFDGVLIRSTREFRRALRVLRRYDAARASEYYEHMREGLRAMEAELDRRGLQVDGGGIRPRASRGVARLKASEREPLHERSPVPPPRVRKLRT